MDLDLHDGTLAVCRLAADAPVPPWAAVDSRPLHAIVRTADELSIVTAAGVVPEGVQAVRDWRALSVRGPLDLAMTGVLAALAQPLADAGVPIFVVSTFDTDWLLVRDDAVDRAVEVLAVAGHVVAR